MKHTIEGTEPISLADGQAVVIDARGLTAITIITGSGATATYSRVDTRPPLTARGATADVVPAATSGAENGGTVAATTKLTITVDYQFYRISVAGGTCRIGAAGAG